VVPPVMAYMVQYLRCWMEALGMPMMSDPHWVAVFIRLVARVCLPLHPSGTCAILRAVPATTAVRLRWVVTLLSGPKVASTPKSLTSREIMCINSGPAACLRCFLAAPLEASMTVLSLLTFIPLSSSAWQVLVRDSTRVCAALWFPALKSLQSSTYVRNSAGFVVSSVDERRWSASALSFAHLCSQEARGGSWALLRLRPRLVLDVPVFRKVP
jgi:hypothetical protein